MNDAYGVVNFFRNHIWVEELPEHPSIGAISFIGRYRVIDFPISNMSNSGINQICTQNFKELLQTHTDSGADIMKNELFIELIHKAQSLFDDE